VNGRYVVDENGERVAVLLDIKEYERMVEELEEFEDILAR
jgi:prevent-host-death family protein